MSAKSRGVRVRGLVKAMNEAREQLAVGVSPQDADAFRQRVQQTLEEVEAACRKHRLKPYQLPGPSYRAYRYLKTIDLEQLPPPPSGLPPQPKSLRIRNLVSACQAFQDQLAELSGQPSTQQANLPGTATRPEALFERIQARREHVERLCRAADTTPAGLPIRSRKAYQWLRFLSARPHFNLHLATLAVTSELTRTIKPRKRLAIFLRNGHIRVDFFHMNSLYRARTEPRLYRITANQGYIGAPPEILEALVKVGTGRQLKSLKNRIRTYAAGEDFLEILGELEFIPGQDAIHPRGRYVDLVAVFERVNLNYFSGQIPRPHLTWSPTLTQRKMGHYQPTSDTVMISLTLDDPSVPSYVVDFVMYHELLHKVLGVEVVNGRRRAHTRAFRQQERQFREFEQVQDFFRKFVQATP